MPNNVFERSAILNSNPMAMLFVPYPKWIMHILHSAVRNIICIQCHLIFLSFNPSISKSPYGLHCFLIRYSSVIHCSHLIPESGTK